MTPRMTPRILSLALIAFAAVGCRNKTINITSTPPGATVTALAVRADKQAEPIELGVTPLKKALRFDEQTQKYELRLNAPLHDEAMIEVAYEPREDDTFDVPLTRYAGKMTLKDFALYLAFGDPTQETRAPHHGPFEIRARDALAYIDVVERSVNINAISRVTTNDDESLQFGRPVSSPAGKQIAYEVIDATQAREAERPVSAAGVGGRMQFHSQIFVQEIGSFARSRLTEGDWADIDPTFSHDGREIIFSSNRGSRNQTLWRKRLDGAGGHTKITSSNAEDIQPDVSPDGQLVVYASLPPGGKRVQIWSVRSNGALPSQLTEGTSPRISPDGKKILFLRRPDYSAPNQIWLMNADGTNETQLTENRDYDIADANWSPDGKWIVFASNENKDEKGLTNWDIYLMAVDSNVKTQLTINGSHDDGPTFDHTGQYIYFRSNRGGVWNIWRCEPKR